MISFNPFYVFLTFLRCYNTDTESKTKGKAAVDVIGSPLGKSGGSLVQQVNIIKCYNKYLIV